MRYISTVPSYSIDLTLSESLRWKDVINSEGRTGKALMREVAKDFERLPWALRKLIAVGYRKLGGLYLDEMKAWSDALDIDLSDMILFQCSYELTQLQGSISLCTSGIRFLPGKGMFHFRTLDWPLKNIGKSTRIFKLRRGKHEAIVVGLVGHVGALSGMVPGRYSVSINWAEQTSRPSFTSIGPTFLLRDALESCDTYKGAVSYLKNEPLFANAFFTVCGVEDGEGCVIERTCHEAAVRKIGEDGVIVQANHYVSKKFTNLNTDEGLMEDSLERFQAMRHAISRLSNSSVYADFVKCISRAPVQNENTYHKMIFHPATGTLKVWRAQVP